MENQSKYLAQYLDNSDSELIIEEILNDKNIDSFGQALEFQKKGIYKIAIPVYRELLNRKAEEKIFINLAICLGKSFKFQEAFEEFKHCLVDDTYQSENMSYYAYILEKTNDLENALMYYKKVLKNQDRNDLWTLSHYAYCLEKAGYLDQAESIYLEVMEKNDIYTWALKRYVIYLYKNKREHAARELLKTKLMKYDDNHYLKLLHIEYLILTRSKNEFKHFYENLDYSGIDIQFQILFKLFYYLNVYILNKNSNPVELNKLHTIISRYQYTIHRDFDDIDEFIRVEKLNPDEWNELKKSLVK